MMWKPAHLFFEDSSNYNDTKDQESEEEDDYMSDAFLANCVGSTSDIRPGMPMTSSAKRRLEQEKKKEQDKKARLELKEKKVSQKDRLDEGLNTALGQENKGFAMLQKMGYKPGTSLGKEGSGRLEPVKVELKVGRAGLGLKEMLIEKRRQKQRRYLAKIDKLNKEFDPEKFREQKRLQMQARQLRLDLDKCQRACYRLDTEQGHTEPLELYLWPQHLLPYDEEEEEDNYTENSRISDKSTISSNDTDNTPSTDEAGSTSKDITTSNRNTCEYEDHDRFWSGIDERDLCPQEEERPWQTEMYVDLASTYLREAYCYCIWCGTVYTDSEDMSASCPGDTKQDHDD